MLSLEKLTMFICEKILNKDRTVYSGLAMKSKLSFEDKGTCGISEMKDSIKELKMSMSEIWSDIVEAIEMQVTIYFFLTALTLNVYNFFKIQPNATKLYEFF